jgi:glyoxylase-like metal-dependent hydrolase (beta-lactamase superfamily II)
MDKQIKIVTISDHLFYLSPDPDLICSDVGVIAGNTASLLIDAGASDKQRQALYSAVSKGELPDNFKYMVLTHFHPDHINNVKNFAGLTVYASKNTSRYTDYVNEIIEEPLTLDLGNLHPLIAPLPSIHAKGSLLIYVPEEKTMFVGDAFCLQDRDGKEYTNKDITLNMIATIRKYEVSRFVFGHHDQFSSFETAEKYLSFLYKKCKESKSTDVFFDSAELAEY